MTYIIEIGCILVAFIAGWILRNYFPKYFEEKGKNLATKEDIGEITTIIENIKTNLLKETEILRGNISILNQNKFDISSLFREALIEYNKKYSAWLYSISRFSLNDYNERNWTEIDNYVFDLKKKKYEFNLSEAHLFLFHDEPNHIILNSDLFISTLELENNLMHSINKLKSIIKVYEKEALVLPENKFILDAKLARDISQLYSENMDIFLKIYSTTSKEYSKTSKYINTLIRKTIKEESTFD